MLIEYLLSEKNNAADEIAYSAIADTLKFGRAQGKIQMVDAILNLSATLEIKLKE